MLVNNLKLQNVKKGVWVYIPNYLKNLLYGSNT